MAYKSMQESRELNEAFFEYLSTPGMEKVATDSVRDFTRMKMREDGALRRIVPPIQVSDSDLDPQVDTDKPVIVIEKEPDSPPACSVPFATLPMNTYIRGPKYRVTFDRVVTPRFVKDVTELRTWKMDIQQIIADNAVKDMLEHEDGRFLTACNTVMIAPNTISPYSGTAQWRTFSGVTRSSLQEAFKILPQTYSRLETSTALVNNVFIRDIMKMGRDEFGGDDAQDLLKNGWRYETFMNVRMLVTIKRAIVPDGTMFMFAEPKFLGKFFILEDTLMYIRKEGFMLEFFAYETIGMSIGNYNAIARADF